MVRPPDFFPEYHPNCALWIGGWASQHGAGATHANFFNLTNCYTQVFFLLSYFLNTYVQNVHSIFFLLSAVCYTLHFLSRLDKYFDFHILIIFLRPLFLKTVKTGVGGKGIESSAFHATATCAQLISLAQKNVFLNPLNFRNNNRVKGTLKCRN